MNDQTVVDRTSTTIQSISSKRGLSLKKDCVMNMTVLRHEYKGGCILIFFGERGMGVVQGVDLTY